MDRCVFCNSQRNDFDPEHWVSQWISRATIPDGKGILHHADGREPWVAEIVELTVPHVCPTCNHGWMSDTETKVRNIALPLIDGDETPHTLRRNEQDLLARWCFLKALTLELGRPDGQPLTYPPEMYEGLKRHKRPPHGCVIAVGFRDVAVEEGTVYVWFRSQRNQQALPNGGHLDGYRTALTIKHLVIDIVGVLAPVSIEVKDSDPRLTEIWPFRANFDWPPPGRFAGIVNNDLV